ncbi:16S rRNA (cytosine(1407)-C(5))-methyltransferase RsmF [Kangiella sp. TOML190]|uniref:16S rRNA (cytosine(1407)-C(5))-methyltransferase RsmF n=1 Tax=Kangiella sp. TOML190 TaxID=2931351 RepID=UPI00203DCE35|nr:16S rRNA (cytosine(1407)-C(5))-methyltransferase RsmF [Kangiella sp. TOML190]
MATISEHFIQHISEQGLATDELAAFIDYCQQPLRRSIRLNSLISNDQTTLEPWLEAGFQFEPIPWAANAYWFDQTVKSLPAGLGNYIAHQQGQFYIQEASSMLPVSALFAACPNPKIVLDMAAAPGSKTTQLAAMMNNQGLIVANELSSSRLKGLFSNIQRCGVSNVCLTHADGQVFGNKTPETFDAILLDAPCGGEGTVRKDPEALKDWDLNSVIAMSQLQKALISSAFMALKPGGTLVYSTCTLSKEENQQVCQHLLDSYPEQVSVFSLASLFDGAHKALTEEGYLHIFPQIFDSEGFFVACFKKSGTTNSDPETQLPTQAQLRFPFSKIDNQNLQNFTAYAEHFAWDISQLADNLWQRKNEIWYFPNGIDNLIGKIKMDRMGVKLAEAHKKGFQLEHQAAIAFGQDFRANRLGLTASETRSFYQGRDIFPETATDNLSSEILLTYQSAPIGLGKKVNNRIKNKLPRDLVRDASFARLD